jgi:hypothetical protein
LEVISSKTTLKVIQETGWWGGQENDTTFLFFGTSFRNCMANPWVLSIGSHGYRVCQIHECTATLLHLWLCTWWQTYDCIHCLHMLHCQLLCLCNPLTWLQDVSSDIIHGPSQWSLWSIAVMIRGHHRLLTPPLWSEPRMTPSLVVHLQKPSPQLIASLNVSLRLLNGDGKFLSGIPELQHAGHWSKCALLQLQDLINPRSWQTLGRVHLPPASWCFYNQVKKSINLEIHKDNI